MTQTQEYIISSKAYMPNSCFGGVDYYRLAVMRSIGKKSKIIVDTKNHKIVKIWDRLYCGKTSKCAYQIALREARAFLASL